MGIFSKVVIANVILLSLFLSDVKAQIIPFPMKVMHGSDVKELTPNINIISSSDLKNESDFLSDFLENGFGNKPAVLDSGEGIRLEIVQDLSGDLGDEGYVLKVSANDIVIQAATPTGVFYGIQSFKQLFSLDFIKGEVSSVQNLPLIEITDKPRFTWRSFMLDESRHFKGGQQVKKLLDEMALLKMNVFHWHLTDDQGWRIEIKKYPLLTEIGSKRKDTQTARGSDNKTGYPHEGFYTQEEIKEIIDYAKKRHITIVPEIEMPGHAMAAVAAYPWLGSLGTTKEVPEVFGKMKDSFNVVDPAVVGFLKDVLDEVIALFPGPVIHIGGDEVNFEAWSNSGKASVFMKENNLKSPVDLQIFFTNEISNYLENSGKSMMGWNEILGENIHEETKDMEMIIGQKLSPSSIVHFWKGDLSLMGRAVKEGYRVVNSNHWDTYLDYTYETLPISKSYAFDPIPQGLPVEYHAKILGLGTQIWTEWTPDIKSLEYQVFPRLIAYAEVGWTSTNNKDFNRFSQSLEWHTQRLKNAGIYFGK